MTLYVLVTEFICCAKRRRESNGRVDIGAKLDNNCQKLFKSCCFDRGFDFQPSYHLVHLKEGILYFVVYLGE